MRIALKVLGSAVAAAVLVSTVMAQQAPRENPGCNAGEQVVNGVCMAPGSTLPGGKAGGPAAQTPIESPGGGPAPDSPPQIKVCKEHEVLKDGECRPAGNSASGSTP